MVGDERQMLFVFSRMYSFYECSLRGKQQIDFVPLEEKPFVGKAFAGYDITTFILWSHTVVFYRNQKVRLIE